MWIFKVSTVTNIRDRSNEDRFLQDFTISRAQGRSSHKGTATDRIVSSDAQ